MANFKFYGRLNRSIIRKFFVPIIIVMIIQVILFSCVILWGGTIENLNNNALDILNGRVINRKSYLENEMIQRFSKLDESVKAVDDQVQSVLTQNQSSYQDIGPKPELAEKIIAANAQNMVYLLRKNSVTGAFLILTENDTNYELQPGQSVQKPVIYLRDSDPGDNVSDNSDLYIERAPVNVTKRFNVTMGTGWEPMQTFSGDAPQNSAFYYTPLKAAVKNPNLAYSDLGYWSQAFGLNTDETHVITYSIPLRTKEGVIYGVLGVEISMDYLQKILPSSELDANKNASYVLAVNDDDDNHFKNVVTTGSAYSRIAGDATETNFEKEPVRKDTYKLIKTDAKREDTLGVVQYLKLYNTNTPFSGEKWALIGVSKEKNIFAFSYDVEGMVVMAMIISLAIGIVGIVIAGIYFVKPITALVQQVKKSNPKMPISLNKTNITEIDELATAVEVLSYNVADSASQLSRVIKIADIPIASFRVDKTTNEVDYTDTLFKILQVEVDEKTTKNLSKETFNAIIDHLEVVSSTRDEKNNIKTIELMKADKKSCWIEIKIVEDENSVLGVIRDVTKETEERLKIEHERDHDILTNLLNRRAFNAAIEEQLKHPQVIKTGAFLMMDLDNLKYINDNYGHDFGDAYLRSTANVLKQFSADNAVFARFSGDEFYAFIYGYDNKDQIRPIVAGIRERLLNTPFPLQNDPDLKIRASGGVAWYPDDASSYERLLKYADFAMYQIKNTIKGEFCEFDQNSYNESAYLLENKEELNKFIDHNLVEYHFQPILDIHTGAVMGYEALMRSQLSTLKTPLEILALAKSQSKLHQIESLTWFNTLKAFKEQLESFGAAKLFINSITNQLMSEDEIKEIEGKYGTLLSRLVVELNEGERVNRNLMNKKQDMIRGWGASLAMDDFGTGYNNDANLLFITPDYIKVDMSITQGIDKDVNRQKLLANMVTYFKERGIMIIAEGVETFNELKMLKDFGVDYVQGYYLGRPNKIPQAPDKGVVEEILGLS